MPRRGFFATLFVVALIGAACAPAVIPPAPTPTVEPTPSVEPAQPGSGKVISGLATVESITLIMLESFPVQVRVTATGYLPDPCTKISGTEQTMEGDTIYLKIMTSRQVDVMCIQVLAPFEETYPLDVAGLPAGTYTVDVNGVTDTFTLDVDNALPPEATPRTLSWTEAEKMIGNRIQGVIRDSENHTATVGSDSAPDGSAAAVSALANVSGTASGSSSSTRRMRGLA